MNTKSREHHKKMKPQRKERGQSYTDDILDAILETLEEILELMKEP